MRWPLWPLLCLLALSLSCGVQAPVAPIYLGALLPFSGPFAATSARDERAMWLAVERVNELGGVAGRPLALLTRNTGGAMDRALEAASELLLDREVAALIGPVEPELVDPVAELTSAHGALHLLPAPVRLTTPSGTLPLAPSLEGLGCALFALGAEEGQTSLAVIQATDSRSRSLAEGVARATSAVPQPIAPLDVSRFPFAPDDYSLRELLLAARQSRPSGLILAAEPLAAANVIRTWRSLDVGDGSGDLPWHLGPTLDDAEFFASVPSGPLDDAVGVAPADPERAAAFREAYLARWGERASLTAALFHDAVLLTALALVAPQEPTAELVRAHASSPGTRVDASNLREGLARAAAGEPIDYDGSSSPLDGLGTPERRGGQAISYRRRGDSLEIRPRPAGARECPW